MTGCNQMKNDYIEQGRNSELNKHEHFLKRKPMAFQSNTDVHGSTEHHYFVFQ